MTSSLLKFEIGPVQDFIAQARSTRDLWSGSYLVSWLMAAGIRRFLANDGAELVFPKKEGQPLLDTSLPSHSAGLLTPNLPNIFVGIVQGDAVKMANVIRDAINAEWRNIADAVWRQRKSYELLEGSKARFDAQVERHLSISWVVTPITGTDQAAYAHDYRLNGWQLDAVRQTRNFPAWSSGGWETTGCEKDSLSGREEAVVGGKDWQALVSNEYAHLFKHPDHLGAANVIKRVWHRAFLMQRNEGFKVSEIKAALGPFKIRSTRAIAARDDKSDDEENAELEQGEKYLAAIAFDGDAIGAWGAGEFLLAGSDLHKHHQALSTCLSQFALGLVRPKIEKVIVGRGGQKIALGQLIYAGGDDVVALVPADVALEVAEELRTAFRIATQDIHGQDDKGKAIQPDASVGIAIAHFKSPLQDVIRMAKDAEKHAKNTIGRSSFSVTLIKRSGETEAWGARWGSGGLQLHEGIATAMADGRLSGKFPHRVIELLEPYLTTHPGSTRRGNIVDFQVHEVIQQEFGHALGRQRIGAGGQELLPLLETYLSALGSDPQTCLKAVIGLCRSVAFTQRNRPTKS